MTETIYLEIPLAEFERLHAEVRTLTEQRDVYYQMAVNLGEDIKELHKAINWNVEQRGIQARELDRLREIIERA